MEPIKEWDRDQAVRALRESGMSLKNAERVADRLVSLVNAAEDEVRQHPLDVATFSDQMTIGILGSNLRIDGMLSAVGGEILISWTSLVRPYVVRIGLS